jgi:uncharacterized protein YggU (UPF0235/DUF167 family)
VKPGSKKGPLVETDVNGSLTVFLRERAVDGMANEALIALIADHLGCRKGSVVIRSGHSARHKVLEVSTD